MTQFLPDNLLSLFAARPPLPYLTPADELSINKKRAPVQGMAQYLQEFETEQRPLPEKVHIETRDEKRARRRKDKEELLAYKLEQQIAMWNPADNENATTDPYRTLFVSRLNYETTESRLRKEFEQYGKIMKIIIPHDKEGKPKGYAFIEFSHKSEMSAAYKKADGIKVDGRRLAVDYERGRTNKAWLPRRLGGGKGDTRKAREPRRDSREPDDHHSKNGRDHREERSKERDGDRHRRRSRDRDDRHNGRDRYDDRHRDRRDDRDRRRRDY
ncbi:hypothetical protein FO519_003306 [Halicephalobus sp. NKZ332]|nr:hypothetical protein FO519_003306 [Halicephalobus sp. NKZ332]